jgi:hypothetical protein
MRRTLSLSKIKGIPVFDILVNINKAYMFYVSTRHIFNKKKFLVKLIVFVINSTARKRPKMISKL